MQGSNAAIAILHQSNFAEALLHQEIIPHRIENEVYHTQHSELQLRGVSFMLHNEAHPIHGQRGGIVCDEMGCGKTLQMLTLIVESLRYRNQEKTLVICSSNVIFEWIKQIKTHLKDNVLRVFVYYGQNRSNLPPEEEYDLMITSYETVSQEFNKDGMIIFDGRPVQFLAKANRPSPFSRLFDRVVVDEAHNIRNTSTLRHKAVCGINAEKHWALTGTPIWNSINDLYALLKFIDANPFSEKNTFTEFISARIIDYPEEVCQRLARFLTPIQIRRTKSQLDLPPLINHNIYVTLEEAERLFYEALYNFSRDTVRRLLETHKWLKRTGWAMVNTSLQRRMKQNIITIILRLRQSCIHPQLAIDAYARWKNEPVLNDQQELLGNPQLLAAAAERLKQAVESRNNDLVGKSEEECSVCLTNQPTHAIIPCGHTFCPDCISICQARGGHMNRCPMCRTDIISHKPIEQALMEQIVEEEDDIMIERRWNTYSTKIQNMMNTFKQRLEGDPETKVLIYSQWLGVLNVIQEALRQENIKFLRVDGSVTPASARAKLQDRFNNEPEIKAMLCSLNCTSEGINLQAANIVFIMDPWWTHARADQAGNRAHRVGQHRAVEIIHYVARNTIEERIMELQQRKKAISEATTGQRNLSDGWEGDVRRLLDL